MMRYVLPAVAACVVLALLYVYGVERTGVVGGQVPTAVQASQQYKAQSDVPHPREGSGVAQHGDRGKSSLESAFSAAQDLRVFVESSKQQPLVGGIFYASIAINECRFSGAGDTSASPSVKTEQKREQARARLRSRCASFTESELSTDALMQLTSLRDASRDPLRAAYNKWNEARASGNRTGQQASLDQVLQLRDPMLVAAVSPYSVLPAAFNGIAVKGEELTLYQGVWSLLPCGFGADCGPNNLAVLRECADGGVCYGGKLEMVRAELAKRGFAAATVNQLYTDMMQAAAERRVQAFLP